MSRRRIPVGADVEEVVLPALAFELEDRKEPERRVEPERKEIGGVNPDSGSTKDLPPMSPFVGTGDVLDFLDDLDSRRRILGWSPRKGALMLRAYCRGDASKALRMSAVGAREDASYEEISSWLAEQFGAHLSRQAYLQQLGSLRQHAAESVMAFSLKLRSLMHRLHRTGARVDNAQAAGWFRAGLLPKYAHHFIVHPVEGLDESVRVALALELASASLVPASSVAMVGLGDDSSVMAVETRRCHACGGVGHLKASCPKRDRGAGRHVASSAHLPSRNLVPRKDGVACVYCGRGGHTAERCYQRQRDEQSHARHSRPGVRMIKSGGPIIGCAPVIVAYAACKPTEVLLDSGSDLTIISSKHWRLLSAGAFLPVEPSTVKATSAGRDELRFEGKVLLPFMLKGSRFELWAHVCPDFPGQVLMGTGDLTTLDVALRWRDSTAEFQSLQVAVPFVRQAEACPRVCVTRSPVSVDVVEQKFLEPSGASLQITVTGNERAVHFSGTAEVPIPSREVVFRAGHSTLVAPTGSELQVTRVYEVRRVRVDREGAEQEMPELVELPDLDEEPLVVRAVSTAAPEETVPD